MEGQLIADILERSQDPSSKLDYAVNFERFLVRYRQPDTDYTSGTRVRPVGTAGLQYNCSTSGHTGLIEPRWPTVVGGTVQDGSVIWTAEAVSTSSLEATLSSAVWSADTGITISNQVQLGQASKVFLAGGVDGQTYTLQCAGTMSDGRIMVGRFVIAVRQAVQR